MHLYPMDPPRLVRYCIKSSLTHFFEIYILYSSTHFIGRGNEVNKCASVYHMTSIVASPVNDPAFQQIFEKATLQ